MFLDWLNLHPEFVPPENHYYNKILTHNNVIVAMATSRPKIVMHQ